MFSILQGFMNSRTFTRQFRCYPAALLPGNERVDVEKGGKIIMPPSTLDLLTQLNITYPMLFKLTNDKHNRESHCGVLEFVADEGIVYLPRWMMSNLMLEDGGVVTIENVSLPVATFTKIQPRSREFLDISNPKAVLENTLRHFACLTTGDIIAILYNNKAYEVSVLETKPGTAVCIIECDMNVEFSAPVEYEEDMDVGNEDEVDHQNSSSQPEKFVAFSGEGKILDENKKKKLTLGSTSNATVTSVKRGIPDYNFKLGTLQLIRRSKPRSEGENISACSNFYPFSGAGQALRNT